VGSLLGLTQFRIKRLFAYSTISHVGFILLALAINSTESIQAYIFYIVQYSISNLNAFIILVTIGFSFYLYVEGQGSEDTSNLVEKNNSPVQLISQIKGYFYINSYLAISLAITIFSFVGIPPIVGFFGKQMILSSALDNGYVFMSLVAIITSVIGAGYYLNLIKQVFFYKDNYATNPAYNNIKFTAYISKINNYDEINSESKSNNNRIEFNTGDIKINSGLSVTISILTFLLVLFIFMPTE
jgi:NADH-ubiquinone oxidoreductase chain 2